MTKSEQDKLRSSVLYDNEPVEVMYNGRAANFPKGVALKAYPKMAKHSGLLYPQPKWIACDYYIVDTDGDKFKVDKHRGGCHERIK